MASASQRPPAAPSGPQRPPAGMAVSSRKKRLIASRKSDETSRVESRDRHADGDLKTTNSDQESLADFDGFWQQKKIHVY